MTSSAVVVVFLSFFPYTSLKELRLFLHGERLVLRSLLRLADEGVQAWPLGVRAHQRELDVTGPFGFDPPEAEVGARGWETRTVMQNLQDRRTC